MTGYTRSVTGTITVLMWEERFNMPKTIFSVDDCEASLGEASPGESLPGAIRLVPTQILASIPRLVNP